ncbi:MAG: putative peptidoglycan glycosyltransferase FtsW, partial [Patescibacteria group bacterium]
MIKFFSGYDTIFMISVIILVAIGLFTLASASLGLSSIKFGYSYYYISHQVILGIIPGVIFLLFSLKFHYRKWKNLSLPLIISAVILMTLVFVPALGFYHGGARRWINLFGLSFQPSEFLKFAFIVYLAAWLETRSKDISSFKFGFLPFFIMSGFVASFLIFQPDIGTLFVLLLTVFSLFFISGGKLKQIALMAFLIIALLGVSVVLEPYRLSRIMVFLNPSYDVSGAGYQLNQALTAMGSGGIFGKGFGLSFHKFGLLPETLGDSIFAVIAEELGFLGSILILVLFLFVFLRGIYIVSKAPDSFSYLLGAGIILVITYQALINIAAISGLIPLTGIPLSFISYGGSALA